jgi:RNA polymerase sigma factor (sigma-70 family)
MTEHALTALRNMFVDRYHVLKTKLTLRLGSADLAGDAMQDAWLRLSRVESVGVVQSPQSYLFRIALNAAEDRNRSERRQRLSPTDIDSLLELPDPAPSAEHVLVARADLQAFEVILQELPERRREIFLAARLGNMPRQEIADRLGISRQLVAKELRLAMEHCLARFQEIRD